MNNVALPAAVIQHRSGVSDRNPTNASDAAKQFEALLIASMLKGSREGGASWLGTGEDAAGESAIGFAEEHLSRVLASQGGLGIASMVAEALDSQNRAYAADMADTGGGATTAAGSSGPGQ
jgi:Rod binding domain-containing protein